MGLGGTGKTYVYNTLCYSLCGQGKIVLCVASSGIASLLLIGGRTAHSTFEIPIEIHEGSTCSIGKNSDLAKLTDLVIWDKLLTRAYGMESQLALQGREAPPVRAESHNHPIPGPVRARDSAATWNTLIANPHRRKQGFHHFWIIRGGTHHLNPCLSQQ